jgi:chloride channel 7
MQVQYWAPQSAGAGVILVMAYLNGNHVPNLLRLRTLVSKFVGTVCAVASGLPFGPEGPMVHMGACVASVITYAQCSECGKPARQGSGGLTRR